MGWVTMSERELNRVEVLAQVDDGRLTVANAANMLDLTRRQVFRRCCHVNSPNLQVGKLFVDQAACAADFHASNASSRW